MRVIFCLLLVVVSGCTSYRYEVADRDEGRLQVRKDQDLVLQAAPAELRLRQVESRCVVLVTNPTTQPFEIEAGGSTVVDPTGQSRSIAGQLVPPGAYVKYILPPVEEYAPRGPQFQIGLGMMVQNPPSPAVPEVGDGPREAVYLSPGSRNMEYWEWPGPGQIRLLLSLKQGDSPQRHEIVLRRIKN
jgi:hypothetical protein